MKESKKGDSRAKLLCQLFVSFAKIGVMTFGGGLAMLPMLERELVENKKWVKTEEILDYYAVGQCTPGIIAVNTATFVGYKQSKVLGAIFSTAGVVFPSVVIIAAIAACCSTPSMPFPTRGCGRKLCPWRRRWRHGPERGWQSLRISFSEPGRWQSP